MSKKAAEHHKKASEHHTHAAHHHGEAAKHHDAGHHEKAAHHAHTARGHATHAVYHSEEAGEGSHGGARKEIKLPVQFHLLDRLLALLRLSVAALHWRRSDDSVLSWITHTYPCD